MNRNRTYTSDKTWRLILVGNYGTIIPLGSVKVLLTVLLTALILAVVSASILGVLFVRQKLNYSALVYELDQKQDQLQVMRDKRDMLMAQLVIAESKFNSGGDSEKVIDSKISDDSPPLKAKADSKDLKTEEAEAIGKEKDSSGETPPPISVAISDFEISHKLQSNEITARFKLKNNTIGDQRIGGKCVLLLKGTINGETTIYPIPNVPWENGMPSAKLGRPFFIRNFMTVNLSRSAPDQDFGFDRGVVYIFENKGSLLLKKEIPIDLNHTFKPPMPTESSEENSKDLDIKADIKDGSPVEDDLQNPANESSVTEPSP